MMEQPLGTYEHPERLLPKEFGSSTISATIEKRERLMPLSAQARRTGC